MKQHEVDKLINELKLKSEQKADMAEMKEAKANVKLMMKLHKLFKRRFY